MTLLEAFRELAPPTEDLPPAVQARRQAAAEAVYVALQRVARRAVPGRPEADDLISLAFLRLLTKGPRTRAADAQAADAALAAARRGVQALVRDLPASDRRSGGRMGARRAAA